jgi:hypothetical protein
MRLHRLVIFAAASLGAASPAFAHGDRALSLSHPVRLAEVSADPRDGADTIQIRGLGGFSHLELRAREDLVDIHGLGLRLPGGRIEWLDMRARIAPGEQRAIELPPEARRADAIVVDYGDREHRRRDRTPARLEVYGAALDDCGDEPGYRDYRREPAPRSGWR